MRNTWLGIVLFAAVVIAAAYWYNTQLVPSDAESAGRMGIANPAAVHCTDLHGSIEIVDLTGGGQAGYCHLEDGRVCEEWALLRNSVCNPPSSK